MVEDYVYNINQIKQGILFITNGTYRIIIEDVDGV